MTATPLVAQDEKPAKPQSQQALPEKEFQEQPESDSNQNQDQKPEPGKASEKVEQDKNQDKGRDKGQEEEGKKKNEQDKKQDQADDKKPSEDKEQEQNRADSSYSFSLFRGMSRDVFRENSKRSKDLVALTKPLVVSAEASTVKILNGNRLVSLGIIVDRNGLILTKASELRGELKCKLADGRQSTAVVVGVHEGTDLALLKVDLNDLQPIHWGQEPAPVVGQWIASPVLGEVQLGVIGVNARKIPPSDPFIGFRPALIGNDKIAGVKIDSVSPDSPADEVDLMVGDIIVKINEVEIKNWEGLKRTLGQHDPNDEVTLTIQRGMEELKIKIVLGNKEKYERESNLFPQQDRSNMQNSMGSRPSQRRKDFPLAFQHDLGLNKTTCGGPVVNLDGQVIGINIARSGRVDSLALPMNTVLPVLESLRSGDLAPAKVNQARLTELEKEFKEVVSKLESAPETSSMENQLLVEKARKEELDRAKTELQKALEELENRIKVVELKKGTYEKELKSTKSEQNALARRKMVLERERLSLSTGVK